MKLPTTSIQFKTFFRKVVACAAAASIVVTPAASFSIPMNGNVSGGMASINTHGTGVIVNQITDKAVIDWRSFDVGENESAQFNVPNANSYTLNRISSMNPSQIDGKVSSNGNLMLINPNGMVFGKNARVDANNFLATTSNISNRDFQNGNFNFHSGGNANASIVNNGTITMKNGGSTALVAPNVKNHGSITVNFGKVSLAAGDTFTIDPYGDGLVQLAMPEKMKQALVENSGSIQAHGGKVQLESSIDDVSDGLINLSGLVDVSNELGEGGTITATAPKIISSGAVLNASGATGGGKIYIGGGYQGSGKLKHATSVHMDKNTVIKADATTTGNGGEAVIWSDGTTNFNGTISARGGAKGGNGGRIETSGRVLSTTGGKGDASAPSGNAGTWLLDPYDINIAAGAGANTNVNCVGAGTSTCTPTNTSTIFADNISAALSAGTNVFITTGVPGGDAGNIDVNGNILMNTFAGAATLTLQAANNISLNAGISISAAGSSILNLVLNSDSDADNIGAIRVNTVTLSTNGGNITMGGGALTGGVPTNPARGGGGISSGIDINNSTIAASGGNIWIAGAADNSGWDGLGIYNATIVSTTSSGTITLRGIGGDGGTSMGVSLWPGGAIIRSQNGNIQITGSSAATTSSTNFGIYLTGGTIETTGTGNILLNGTGAASTGGGARGVSLDSGSIIRATGSGNITIDALGGGAGAAGSNNGFYIDASNISTTTGSITINARDGTGTGGGNTGFWADNNLSTINSTSGNIALSFDSRTFNNFTSATTGNLALAPFTSTSTLGIMGGAGVFQVDNALLAPFTAGSYTFGKIAGAGALTANAHAWTLPVTLLNGNGDININGLQNMGANAFIARTTGTGDVVLGAAGEIASTAAGSNIILAAGRNFLNNSLVGAPLSTGAGNNWLIYGTSPGGNVLGTLAGAYYRYSCVYLGTCPALGAGNGLLYSMTPMLNVTPNGKTIMATNPAGLSPYAYTLTGYLGADAGLDIVGGAINGSTAYTVASAPGSYDITYASGALTSALGYGFNYLNNPAGLTVTANNAWGGGGGTSTPSLLNPITSIPTTPATPSAPSSPSSGASGTGSTPSNGASNITPNSFPETVLGVIVNDNTVGSDDNSSGSNVAAPIACLTSDEDTIKTCNASQVLSGVPNK